MSAIPTEKKMDLTWMISPESTTTSLLLAPAPRDFIPEIGLAVWCICTNPEVPPDTFVYALCDKALHISQASSLISSLTTLDTECRACATELVAAGAFSRRELLEPERILAFFARPNWREIVEAWRKSETREIRHIVKRCDPDVKQPEASQKPTATLNTRLSDSPPPPVDPLRAAIEAALPGKCKKQVANCMAALHILAKDPTLRWTSERMSRAVERARKSCGATFPEHVAAACLRHMAASGLVAQCGEMFGHKPR